eukprot:XP_011663928.1 PREDICTED: uncharacterized protein LOC589178 isoform X1 [Strongylocentrotus purpuratus]
MHAHSAKLSHPHGSGKKAKRSLSHEHMRTHSKESKDQPDLGGARSGMEPKPVPHPIDISSNHHNYAEAHPNFQDGKGNFLSRDGLRLSKEKQRSHDAPCSPRFKESYMHLADSSGSPRSKDSYMHHADSSRSPRLKDSYMHHAKPQSPRSPLSPKSPKIKDSHFSFWPNSPKSKESYTHHAEVPKSPRSKEPNRHSGHGHQSPNAKDVHRMQDPGSPKHKGKDPHHQCPSDASSKDSRFQRKNSAEKPSPGKGGDIDNQHDPLVPVHSGSPPVIRAKDANGHVQLREAYAHRRRTGAMSHPNLHHKHLNGCKSRGEDPRDPPSPELPAKSSRRRAASSEDTTTIGPKSPDLTPLIIGVRQSSESVEHKRQSSSAPISPQRFFQDSHDSAGQSSPELPARARRKKQDKAGKSNAHQSPELPLRVNGKEKNCNVFDSSKKQGPNANHKTNEKGVRQDNTKDVSENNSSVFKNSDKLSDGSFKGLERDTHSEVGKQKRSDKVDRDVVVKEVKPKVTDQSTTMSIPVIVADKEAKPLTGNRVPFGEENQKELLDMIDNDCRTKLHPGRLDDRYLGGGMVGGHLGVYRSASMPGFTDSSRQLVSRATCMSSGGGLISGLTRSSMTRKTLRQKQTKSWTGCGDGSPGCSDNWRFCPVHKVCNSVVDIAVMQEAHGLIMDMLADSTLPPNVVSGLKAVSSLLSPPTNYNTLQRPKISPLVALSESMYTSDIDDSPYVGERPLSLPKRLRRSLPPSLIRRMSTTWTTTTSATGMPTLEPQPLRTRSSSFRHSRDLTSSPSPGNSRSSSPAPLSRQGGGDGSLKSRSFSVGTGGLGQRSPSPNLMPPDGKGLRSSSLRGSLGGSSMPTLLKTENGQSPRLDDSLDAAEESDDDTSRLEELSNQPITLTITPDDAVKDASENVENAESTAAPTDNNNTNNVEKSEEPSTLGSSLKPRGSSKKRGSVTISEHATIIEEGMARTIPVDETAITEATEEQDEELAVDESLEEEVDPTHGECRELLGRLDEWDFPIFEISELSENQVLSQVAYRLFTDAGIFETFRISLPEFMNYFRALECGYRHKPYHNRIHAADVLHGCYYMSTQQIPGFTQVNPEDLDPMGRQDDDPDSFHTPTVTPRASISSDSSYGILAGNLPALELMALYTAAAMHDYDHPGRTNAFLVATSASQAILYNDRSVLENHHAAASWSLFLSKPEYNFLSSLDIAEFKRFRFLVVEYILATDLKRHFDFLVEFNSKVNDVDAPGINWAVESDRLLVCQMCIKLADISGPTKIKDLHCNWTYRISEEFYEQGDDERNLGLTVSPYMDRNAPQLAKLQEGFINHLVAPLCNAYGSAGLLPGRWLDEEDDDHAAQSEPKEESEMREFSDKDNDDDDDDDDDNDEESNDGDSKLRLKSAGQQKTRKMVSILTKHLKENHEMWLKVLKEEEAEKRRTENPDGLPPSPTSKDKEDGMNLSAIHTPNHEIIRQVFIPRGQDISPKNESKESKEPECVDEEESMKSMAPIREDSEERTSDCSRSMEGDNGVADQELSEDGCQDNTPTKPDEGSRVGDVQKAAEET